MRFETLDDVGKSILNLPINNKVSVSILNGNYFLKSNYCTKTQKLDFDSEVSLDPYTISSSIGANKQIFKVKHQIPNGNVELACNNRDFLQMDAKFVQKFNINSVPIKFSAEYLRQKPNLSVEFTKSYSFNPQIKNKSIPIRGLIFLKYGKSIDMTFNFLLPFFESHFSADSENITFSNAFGYPNMFINYSIRSDYLEINHYYGLYTTLPKLHSTFSVLYQTNNQNTDQATNQKATIKVEAQPTSLLTIAYSRTLNGSLSSLDQLKSKLKEPANSKYGCIFNFNDKFHSKLHLYTESNIKQSSVKYEMKKSFHNNIFDASFSYSFETGNKSFGLNITSI